MLLPCQCSFKSVVCLVVFVSECSHVLRNVPSLHALLGTISEVDAVGRDGVMTTELITVHLCHGNRLFKWSCC